MYHGHGRTTQLRMLKKSVPPSAWLSLFAVSMRWTMYPPSLPAFHTFHHCTASGITKTTSSVSHDPKSGMIESRFAVSGLLTMPAMPPTSGRRRPYTIAATAPAMITRKRQKSVQITPRMPPKNV